MEARTLAVVDESGEDDDGEREREDEEAEFGGAALERVAEDPQARRMPRELEDAEHAENSQRRERAAELVLVREQQRHVERHAVRARVHADPVSSSMDGRVSICSL